MKRDCMIAEEAIWDYVRDGVELPADVLRHIERCPECARALDEAAVGMPLLRRAERYAPAPDARAHVMERITATQPMRPARLRWALAAVVVLIAAIVCAVVLVPHSPDAPAPVAVRSHQPPETPASTAVAQHATGHEGAAPPPVVRAEPAPREQVPRDVQVERSPRVAIAPSPHAAPTPPIAARDHLADQPETTPTVHQPAASDQPSTEAPAAAPDDAPDAVQPPEPAKGVNDGRPIAMVAVVWEQPDADSAGSYEYSTMNIDTGVTTTYKVIRNGDAVEVDVESSSHRNGGSRHETNSGA